MSLIPNPPAVDPAWARWLDERFAWSTLTVRQKLLTIAQRYELCDPQGNPLFYVLRPPKFGLSLMAVVAGGIIRLLFFVLAFRFFLQGDVVTAIALIIAGGIVPFPVVLMLMPYCDIRVLEEEEEK